MSLGDAKTIVELDWSILWKAILIIIAIIIIGIKSWDTIHDKIVDKFGINTKKSRQEKADHDMLIKHDADISSINSGLQRLGTKFDRVADTLQDISQRQEQADAAARESSKVKSKDRLYQSYRFYKRRVKRECKKEWTSIESDGFWSLFHDYEANGGNGKLHTEVQPYMEEFIIVDERDN